MGSKAVTTWVRVICILATLGGSSYCIYKYMLDEDVSNITYQLFGEREEDKYPTISFCFYGDIIFNGKAMQSAMNEQTKASTTDQLYTEYESLIHRYKKFLNGENSEDVIKNIAYENATIDMRDHLNELLIMSSGNQKMYHWKNGRCSNLWKDIITSRYTLKLFAQLFS